MKLDQLPEELYGAILETIGDLEQRKQSTVALSRALPRSPVSSTKASCYILSLFLGPLEVDISQHTSYIKRWHYASL